MDVEDQEESVLRLLIIQSSRQAQSGQLLLGAPKACLGRPLKPVRDAARSQIRMAFGC